MIKRAIFLDKDGTLIENVPYNVDPERIRLASNACDGLKLLQEAGYLLFVVTNQSGVARGLFREEALIGVEQRLRELLAEMGVQLSGFYYCPHFQDGKISHYSVPCICRKPKPGMLFRAAREHDLNLAESWVIGDILDDVEAGRRADCWTIHVRNGNDPEWDLSPLRRPNYTVSTLYEAACLVSNASKAARAGSMAMTQPANGSIGASL